MLGVAPVIGRFLIALLPLSLAAQTTPCDPLHPLEASPYQYRERGNRCEGLYVAEVAAHSLELVSLSQGPIVYPLRSGLLLQVAPLSNSGKVHVRAVPKPPRMYYRMDAVVEPGSVLTWPVSDVLLPQNITANRIGVFAWKGNENERIYVPVRVAVSTGGPAPSAPVILSIRPSFDAEAVKWRSAVLGGRSCEPFGAWNDATHGSADAGQPVEISLGGLTGLRCIEVAARSADSNAWSTASIRTELPSK